MSSIEASEIIPNLWQGSYPPFGSRLNREGFKLLVLCANEFQFETSLFDWCSVVHAPNEDSPNHPLTREQLVIAVSAARKVADAVNKGQKTLVTCAAGLNRSGLVTGISLHLIKGWDGEACIERVRTRRGKRGDLYPLCNESFAEALRKLPGILPQDDGPFIRLV